MPTWSPFAVVWTPARVTRVGKIFNRLRHESKATFGEAACQTVAFALPTLNGLRGCAAASWTNDAFAMIPRSHPNNAASGSWTSYDRSVGQLEGEILAGRQDFRSRARQRFLIVRAKLGRPVETDATARRAPRNPRRLAIVESEGYIIRRIVIGETERRLRRYWRGERQREMQGSDLLLRFIGP